MVRAGAKGGFGKAFELDPGTDRGVASLSSSELGGRILRPSAPRGTPLLSVLLQPMKPVFISWTSGCVLASSPRSGSKPPPAPLAFKDVLGHVACVSHPV